MRWAAQLIGRRSPTPLLLVAVVVHAAAWLAVAAWRRPWLLLALSSTLLLASAIMRDGWLPVVALLGVIAAAAVVGLAGWSWLAPGAFERAVAGPVRSWRRRRHYAARWDAAMDGCGLVRAGEAPTLMAVRSADGVDRLSVHMAPGQLVTDWRDAAPRLASALEVRSVRARRDGPRDVLLLVRWREIRLHDPEVGDDAAVAAELAETVGGGWETNEQLAARLAADLPEPTELPRPAFPRRPR
jgi:hypothetical protein